MKRTIISIISILLFSAAAHAALKVPLYPEFRKATVYMSNHTRTIAPMNYDMGTDKMYFKDGETVMELTGDNQIDSIVWAGEHSFVLLGGKFCEKLQLGGKPVLVHWRLKKISIGKSGALGANTQGGNVTEMNLSGLGMYGAGSTGSVENFKYVNTNEYFIPVDGGVKKITSLKHLYKFFPAKAGAARQFMKDEGLEPTRFEDFMKLIAFCLQD